MIPSAPNRLGSSTFHPSISSWSYLYLGYAALMRIMLVSMVVLLRLWLSGCCQSVPSLFRLLMVLVGPRNQRVPS